MSASLRHELLSGCATEQREDYQFHLFSVYHWVGWMDEDNGNSLFCRNTAIWNRCYSKWGWMWHYQWIMDVNRKKGKASLHHWFHTVSCVVFVARFCLLDWNSETSWSPTEQGIWKDANMNKSSNLEQKPPLTIVENINSKLSTNMSEQHAEPEKNKSNK